MFEKGRPEAAPGPVVATNFVSLFQACIDVLRGEPRQAPATYHPPKRELWTTYQALARMRSILGTAPEGGDLLGFLPEIAADVPDRAIYLKTAISSTLVASLELARDAQAELDQPEPFASISVRRAAA
jgi:chromatin segregation and condensation protein Rec8/ScpA/Scc1 (kleisin family)